MRWWATPPGQAWLKDADLIRAVDRSNPNFGHAFYVAPRMEALRAGLEGPASRCIRHPLLLDVGVSWAEASEEPEILAEAIRTAKGTCNYTPHMKRTRREP